jgi:hypothetical protein
LELKRAKFEFQRTWEWSYEPNTGMVDLSRDGHVQQGGKVKETLSSLNHGEGNWKKGRREEVNKRRRGE